MESSVEKAPSRAPESNVSQKKTLPRLTFCSGLGVNEVSNKSRGRRLESSKFRPDQFLDCKLHNPFNGHRLWVTEAPRTGIDTRFSVPFSRTLRLTEDAGALREK